jgi:hypothetical protein
MIIFNSKINILLCIYILYIYMYIFICIYVYMYIFLGLAAEEIFIKRLNKHNIFILELTRVIIYLEADLIQYTISLRRNYLFRYSCQHYLIENK